MAQKRRGGLSRARTTGSGIRDQGGPDVRARELILQGQDLLARSRIAAAQRKFRQALGLCETSIGARSHLALTHLLQGECDQAENETKVVLEMAPDNVLALTTLARVQAAQERWSEAETTMVRALRCFYADRRAGVAAYDDLVNAAQMLAAMGDDRRLHQLYRRCVRGTPGAWDALMLTHMGIAAFNIGRYVEARWLWRMALDGASDDLELRDAIDAFLFAVGRADEEQGPPFSLDHRLRPGTVSAGESNPPGFVKAMALRALWQEGDMLAKDAAIDLLGQMDDPWVAGLLLDIVRQPELPDPIKMKAGVWLVERGFINDDEPLEMHVEGRLQEVIIEQETDQFELPSDAMASFERAVKAYEQGDEGAAEAAYREVLDVEADFVPALIGLANICRTTGRGQEAGQLLSRALRANPHDPMILFNLAILWAQEEKYDQVQRTLQLLKAAELPRDMRASYFALVGHVALQLDMPDTAEQAFLRCLRADPDNEQLSADLEVILESLQGNGDRGLPQDIGPGETDDGDSAPEPAIRPVETGENSGRQPTTTLEKRYEHQPIDPAWPWTKALTGLTRKRLQATARRLRVKKLWSMRKADLSAAIAGRLRGRLPWVWQALGEEERAALRWIDEQGGIVTLDRLRERFGADGPDNVDWSEDSATVPTRLQFWGLIFVGRLRGTEHPVAVLLEETRRLLHDMWRHG